MTDNNSINLVFTTFSRTIVEVSSLLQQTVEYVTDGKIYDFSVTKHIDRFL